MTRHKRFAQEQAAIQTDHVPFSPLQKQEIGTPTLPPLHQLQRKIGNQAIGQLLQTKLTINQPGDPYEQEADSVAERVMRMPQTAVQRKTCSCGKPAGPDGMCEDCRRKQLGIQRKTVGDKAVTAVPPIVHQALQRSGRPLDSPTRLFMESRFGHDFGPVRIHTDGFAAASAQAITARAYTAGNNIFFNQGQFMPATTQGKRLLAHELTHVIQQGAVPSANRATSPVMRSAAHMIQREVELEGISTASEVLSTINTIGQSYLAKPTSGDRLADLVAEKGAKVASTAVTNNMARLVALSKKFNPGAPGQAGPTNAFVYTCHCGWIDMGHFFISAVGAFAAAYAQQLALRIEGEPTSQGKLLALGFDKLAPWLEPLLDTVGSGGKGKEILTQQRALFKSGEPRDISLGFGGYTTEYYQQLGKLFADPMQTVPKWLEGEQRSAFTMEDFPSDCYGAAIGQALWYRVSQSKQDISPLHDLINKFFTDCKAVSPIGSTRCRMMAETTPGSCQVKEGQPKWSADRGTPRQHTTTTPYLLNSAEPLCGKDPAVLPCASGTGPTLNPLPKAELDLSWKNKSATLTLFDDIPLPIQPQPTGSFGGDVKIPGRPERLDPQETIRLGGPSRIRLDKRLTLTGLTTLRGVPHLGDTRLLAQLNPLSGRIRLQADGQVFSVEATGELSLDYKGLFSELTAPEVERFRQILTSDDFSLMVKQFVSGKINYVTFYNKAKKLLQEKFPEGWQKVGEKLLQRLKTELPGELLPIYTGIKGSGTVNVFGLPISFFTVQKGTGRKSPLWGTETGFLSSDLLFNKRAVAGTKAWLYGQDVLQGYAEAGLDLFSQKLFAEVFAETKYFTGMKLNARMRYDLEPRQKNQLIFFSVGGQHRIGE